jgi:transcriptional regulator with XRE-family HTH domain
MMGGRNQADVAEISGISQSTISRWRNEKGGTPSADSAVAFARATGGNPVEALVLIGAIKAEELGAAVDVHTNGDDLTDAELVVLVARRLGVPVQTGGGRR